MTDTSLNPAGAGFFNAFTNGALRQQYVVNPVVDGSLPIGTVVQIDPYDGPGNNERSQVPQVQPSSTEDSTSVIGVVSLGSDLSGRTSVPPGAVATVTCQGVCQVLCDATTTAGEALVQSLTTAGAAETSPSPTTRAFGVALQSVTIPSGTALVWAYVSPGGSGGGGGGGVAILPLYYGGYGPFDVPCWGIPTGYAGGIASLGAQLTVGVNIASGLLLDVNGDAIPDGFTFPATIFVEGDVIYDILSFSAWNSDTNGGVNWWGDGGGTPLTTAFPGGLIAPLLGSFAGGLSLQDYAGDGLTLYSSGGTISLDGDTGVTVRSGGVLTLTGSDGITLINGADTAVNLFISAGNPNGVVTSIAKGDVCFDVGTPALWQAAVGLSDVDWVQIGAGGAVTSVFGRTGPVVAMTGDYTAAEVGADPSGSAAAAQAAAIAASDPVGSAATAQSNAEAFATAADATVLSTAEAYAVTKANAAQAAAEAASDPLGSAATAQANAEAASDPLGSAATAQANAEAFATAADTTVLSTAEAFATAADVTNLATAEAYTDAQIRKYSASGPLTRLNIG